jgi:YD repeat-containing protein
VVVVLPLIPGVDEGPAAYYTLGTPSSAVVSIADNDLSPVVPPDGCGCGGPADEVRMPPGLSGNPASGFGEGGIRSFDGTVQVSTSDLSSDGFGVPWGQDRSWTNAPGYASGPQGNGQVDSELPYLAQDSAGTVAAVSNGTTARFFDPNGSNYQPRYFLQEQLSHDNTAHTFTLTDASGNRLVFADFNTSLPANQRGQLVSLTDPDGNVTQVTSRTTDGKPTEVQRSNTSGGVTTTESYLYTYLSSGANAGRLANVTLRRQVNGGAWSTVRQTDYTYYDGVMANGTLGDLKTAVVKDAAGNALDTQYYRYYTAGQANGYAGGLKYVFGAQSYARLAAAFADPTTATDAQVAPYADSAFQYDSVHRVTQSVVQGAGCSVCTGGLGTYTESYATSAFANGYNSWKYKTEYPRRHGASIAAAEPVLALAA